MGGRAVGLGFDVRLICQREVYGSGLRVWFTCQVYVSGLWVTFTGAVYGSSVRVRSGLWFMDLSTRHCRVDRFCLLVEFTGQVYGEGLRGGFTAHTCN